MYAERGGIRVTRGTSNRNGITYVQAMKNSVPTYGNSNKKNNYHYN